MLLPILGSSILGGLIGYITNWVAIKMLFRPLEEKRVLGIRVPFTPGVIPKQRDKLAISIGDAVGTYLLTPEALLEPLNKPDFERDIEGFISHALQKLSSNSEAIGELLQRYDLLSISENLQQQARQKLTKLLQSDEVQEVLIAAAEPVVHHLTNATVAELFADQTTEQRRIMLREALLGVLQNPRVLDSLRYLIDRYTCELYQSESTLRESIPDQTILAVKGAIADAGPSLLRKLEERLRNEENRQALKQMVKDFLSSSTMLRIASAFIDADRLLDSLITSLQKDETRALILQQVLDAFDKLLDMPMTRLTKHIHRQTVLDLSDLLLQRVFNDALADKLAYMAEHWFVANREHRLRDVAVATFGDEPLSALAAWSRAAIKQALGSAQTAKAVNKLWARAYAQLLDFRPGSLFGSLTLAQLGGAKEAGIRLIRQLAERYGARLLAAMKLPDLVEQQVNRLDVLQVEDILLKVMNNQLRAITSFGLLLGAIIGIIMPFLNLWLMGLGN